MTLKRIIVFITLGLLAGHAVSQDKVRAAVGQRGNWDTLFISQGTEAGIFKKNNLEVDITWRRGRRSSPTAPMSPWPPASWA